MSADDPKEEKLTARDRGFMRMRSIMDLGMGMLWISMGVFMLFIRHFNTGLEARYDDPMMKVFGAICLLYGSFRIYRGLRKKYFTD